MSVLKGVVLVGGPSVGTRFRPLSMDCPKPLFPIAGTPMIYHHVAALAQLSGMKEIILIGFFDQAIFDRFLMEIQIEFPGVSIRYLREYSALGTGGGLYHFRDEILRGDPDHIFVLNADVASSFPLAEVLAFHKEKSAIGTIMGMHVPRSDVHKYGCVVVHPTTQEVSHFVEKPETFISDIISCGIYVFDKNIFPVFQTAVARRREREIEEGISSRTPDERIRLEQDVLNFLAGEGKLFAHIIDTSVNFWMQIKTGSSLIPANREYLQHFRQSNPKRLSTGQKFSPSDVAKALATGVVLPQHPEYISPVYIHPTAVVHPTAKIGPNVSIGPRALVGPGVRIRDSIVLDNTEVKHDSILVNSVIGWETKIGAWARVEGAPGEASTYNATSKGFKIPSACIVGKDVFIADEIVVRNCIVLPHKEIRSSVHNEILM
ncbi:nucleotide-diphospho-sugar transferase [Polychytrium aggregatum]|uniref:nucleotide-diphospho-sugar transferase n=1 Tax=Polychytrium aggregatum TaxID=110093 RepID=UPI0022FE53E9|nr:nucleotide-diphospho-sugar transferase [Polychytrium aggregatum]KAI9208091.1 nucleotide-diphospho-sugar transferase [Polychytrium aggregatum]